MKLNRFFTGYFAGLFIALDLLPVHRGSLRVFFPRGFLFFSPFCALLLYVLVPCACAFVCVCVCLFLLVNYFYPLLTLLLSVRSLASSLIVTCAVCSCLCRAFPSACARACCMWPYHPPCAPLFCLYVSLLLFVTPRVVLCVYVRVAARMSEACVFPCPFS
jgi:hypothetical protein